MPFGDKPLSQKLVPFFLFVGFIFALLALRSLTYSDHVSLLRFVLLIAVCYLFIDLLICWASPPERRKRAETALYCDMPTMIAFFALLVYSKKIPAAKI
jgi:hypothetical protein